MEDATKEVDQATTENAEVTEANDAKTSFTIEDVQKLVNEQVENVKSDWMKRFDQKNTEATQLKKKISELERASLSEKERLELERQDLENALKEKERDLEVKQLNYEKTVLIAEANLEREYIDLISGENVEVFKKNIESISKKINDEVEKRVNDRLGNSVKTTGNTNNDTNMQDEIDRLIKEGKLTEAIALQNKLYKMTQG